MSKAQVKSLRGYADLLGEVKTRIAAAQTRAIFAANAEMIRLYWDIGQLVLHRQQARGWGASVIPRLAGDIRNELPEVKGFSERNIGYMMRFAAEYPILQRPVAKLLPGPGQPILHQPGAKSSSGSDGSILQQPVAKLGPGTDSVIATLVPRLPWGHNLLLIEKIKDHATRLWYMQQTLENGWSRDVLALMIEGQAHHRQGKAVTNFTGLLPPPQSDLAVQTLKDSYIFDFVTLDAQFHERELETQLLAQLGKFFVELGQGFSFVGRQYPIAVDGEDFYVDLLFYHLRLRCFIVIDLKKGAFKPEYAGKMNFYLNVIDDKLRHSADSPSIGLILCQDRNRIIAEYALRGMKKPIGIGKYQLTRALPRELRSSLPTIEEIEAELTVRPKNARKSRELKKTRRQLKSRRTPPAKRGL